ncbi:TRAP transporter small permease [Salmonella enterica]|nr:TRAP transporter small permease [Salmonella enterica]EBE4964248.1 TRAP transporter small permease [Salmonella enterica]EBT5332188.1 TRAP transporter small permease [Salmonella enterica]ECH4619482.1 TRAP transporter small permease [Salmonella enterica]EGG9187166.1 TRAP transporter small permease [Salmonella enterica]
MRNIISSINTLLATLNIAILTTIVMCVTWQVVARFIFKSPSIFTDELSRLLFICLGLFGGAYTAGQSRHLAIDLLPMMLQGKARRHLFLCIQAIVIVFAALIMVYGGGLLTLDTFDSGQTSPALGWQMGYIYMSIPISGVLIIIYTVDIVLTELKQPL